MRHVRLIAGRVLRSVFDRWLKKAELVHFV